MKSPTEPVARRAPLGFVAGYGLALGSTALAALVRLLLPWVLTPAPYLGFYPAVVVSAALGGVGPGLVATFASLFLVNFVFGHFNVQDHGAMARQFVWVAASLGVSLLAGMQRAARLGERRQAEELRRWNDELEQRVAAQTLEIRKTNETLELQVAERTSQLRASNLELERSRSVATDLLQDALDARRQAEQAAAGLGESEEQFRTLANAIPQLCWMANSDGWIFWYNQRWYEYTGKTPEQMAGWGWQSVHDPTMLPEVMERWQASIATSEPFDMVFPLRGSDGVLRPFLTRVMPVCDLDGEVVRWFGTNTDVSEQRKTLEALRESEEKLSMALRSAGMGAWRLDLREQTRQFDDQVCRCLGIDPARFGGTNDEFMTAVHPEDRDALRTALQRTVEAGAPYAVEYRAVWPDGRIRHIATRGQLARDAAGQPQWVDGLVWDITERKRAEESLQKAHGELALQMEQRTRELREKEVMLKEIHHRVKNNLQVISSLISLQADGASDQVVRGVLNDVTYRVRSMALVHEKLYQSESLALIDFAEYTRSLLNYLWQAHGAAAAAVRLSLELEQVSLPVDTAVPCGLILNELAGNALKHAFRTRDRGEVTISLGRDADRAIRLRVRDDGVGLPPGLDWRQCGSLGLRLVQMLAGQLNAAVALERSGGTEFLISFNLPERAKNGEHEHEHE